MSLCGPSTAPQALSKHLQTDRTLQQERLRSVPSSSQSFRTTIQPSAHLDREFEAFSGLPTVHHAPSHLHPQHFTPPPLHQQPHQPQQHRKLTSSWASDFQALSLHSTKSTPSLRQQASAPRTTAGWGHDFMSFAGIQQPVQQRAAYVPHQPYYTATASYGVRPVSSMETMDVGRVKEDVSTQAAFDAAFEEVAMMDAAGQQDALDALDLELQQPVPAPEVPAPVVEEQKQEEPQDKAQDGDALARTAGELLSSVESDQSDKFRESKFLALMRKLRDKEAMVEGDKFVENVVPAGSREEKGKAPAVDGYQDWTNPQTGVYM